VGPKGADGADSTVPGPEGKRGEKGDKGDKGDPGETTTGKAKITGALYMANYDSNNPERVPPSMRAPAPQAELIKRINQGINDLQGIEPHKVVGDPAWGFEKATTILWQDNAGKPHTAWINGNYIGGDTLWALNRRFAIPGEATDLWWTGSSVV
jgi:hypothetical protein